MSPTTLEAIVAEHNALQPHTAPKGLPAGSRAVIIAQAGKYNDYQDNAHDLVEGDALITRPWYAEYLVETGQAGWPAEKALPKPKPEPEPEPAPGPESEPEQEPKPVSKPKPRTRKKAGK